MREPCPGLSMMKTLEGHTFLRLHYSSDETLTPERIEQLRKRYTSQAAWNAEMEIDAHARSGQLVYPEFDSKVHVVPDAVVPKRGLCRYMAIDPHPRTPDAMLWIGIDQWSDWWAYREIWPSKAYGARSLKDSEEDYKFNIREYAEMVAKLEGNEIEWRNAETDQEYGIYRRKRGGERIIYRFMDQAGKGFRASDVSAPEESFARRYARYGIECSDPYKSHGAGEDAVHELLQMRHHNLYGAWPRLHIAESLKELQFEFRSLRYEASKPSDTRELKQQAAKIRSHLLDGMRYLACSGASWIPGLAS
jgi:hypothetical protein